MSLRRYMVLGQLGLAALLASALVAGLVPGDVAPSNFADAQEELQTVLDDASPVALATCTSNDQKRTSGTSGEKRCVAGSMVSTRRWLKDVCTQDKALFDLAIYTSGTCNNTKTWTIEMTAQARAVYKFNAAYKVDEKGPEGDPAGEPKGDTSKTTGVHPDIQWETTFPKRVGTSNWRSDILIYDSSKPPPNTDVKFIEVKTFEYATADVALKEVQDYSRDWPGEAAPYPFPSGYTDSFEIVENESRCSGGTQPQRRYFDVTAPYDGVLYVTERKAGWAPVDPDAQIPTGLGTCVDPRDGLDVTIGEDKNGNGRDDALDLLESNPEYKQRPTPLPNRYSPVTNPVRVHLDPEGLSALETAARFATAAQWATFVAQLAITTGRSAAVLLEGQALLIAADISLVEAGMTSRAVQVLAGNPALMARAAALGFTSETLVLAIVRLGSLVVAYTMTAVAVTSLVIAVVLLAYWALHKILVYCEPRLATIDGLGYALQSVGEFRLMQIPGTDIEAQVRFRPIGPNASTTGVFAVNMNGSAIEMHDNGTLLVNGVTQPSNTTWLDFGQGTFLVKQGSRFLVMFADGTSMIFESNQVGVRIASGVPTKGLLGDNDGVPENDLVTQTGEQLTKPSTEVVHGRYADSWRISDEESLFAYPEYEGTEDYTDLSHPDNILTLGDFAPEDRTAAAEACRTAGVVEGPQFENCVLDVATTGDTRYATETAAVTQFLQDPTAREVSAQGVLDEGFEGAVPANLRPLTLMSVPGGQAAGPVFDKSGYSFTVPGLPKHIDTAVSFDLFTFGLSGSKIGSTRVEVAGLPAVTLAFTATAATVTAGSAQVVDLASGTATPGGVYRRYRVTVRGEHLTDQLRVSFLPSGFRGVLDTSVAVDAINVAMTVVPPQVFTTGIDMNVSDGVPAGGAGRLETKASQDTYRFTAGADDHAVYVLPSTCPSGLLWELRAVQDRSVLRSGACGSSDVRGLIPGQQYELNVHASTSTTVPVTYALALRRIPDDVQVGSIDIDGPAMVIPATVAGQNASATFSGTAGQRMQFQTTGSTYTSNPVWSIIAPDGKTLASSSGNRLIDTTTLPLTGTYTFKLDPLTTTAGSISVLVRSVPADVDAGSFEIDGPAKTVTTTAAGQNSQVTFTAAAGQRIQWQSTGSTYSTAPSWEILRPNGKFWYSGSGNLLIDTSLLADGGTYTIKVNPSGTTVGAITFRAWSVPADADAGPFDIDGPAKTVTTTAPGQGSSAQFTGTAGQQIRLQTTVSTYSVTPAWSVVRPNGSTLVSGTGNSALGTTTLPETGTYSFKVNPYGVTTGQIAVRAWSIVPDVNSGATAVDEPALTVATVLSGQRATATFAAVLGQRVQVEVAASTFASPPAWTLRTPDGSILSEGTGERTSSSLTLPESGTYTFILDPHETSVGAITVRVFTTPAGEPDPTLVFDQFERAVSGGLGTADQGGAWSYAGAGTTAAVLDGSARVTVEASKNALLWLPAINNLNTELTSVVWTPSAPSGGGLYVGSSVRITPTGSYRARLRLQGTGTVTAQFVRAVGVSDTLIGSSAAVSGVSYTAGMRLRVRTQALGSSPTTLRTKIWAVGTPEPTAWTLSVTDATAGYQSAGSVGLWAYASGTSVTSTVQFDALQAVVVPPAN